MPNWTFLALHFFHTMALALWVGGAVAIGAVVAPVLFRTAPDRRLAGRIFGRALRRFDAVVGACIAALVVTSVLMVSWYGRWSAWYAIEYACIVLMSLSALATMIFITPRLEAMQEVIATGATSEERARFDLLHQLATLSMQFNLACDTVAVMFS